MKNLSFDWNDLKFFLATARHGGLTGAAAALHTSPSTVSRHVTALEERMQATLFLRQQSGYQLTDDGDALFKHVEQVEQAMMAAERNGHASAQREITGQVRLATSETLAIHLIVPNLHLFRAQYPRLSVEMNISLARANLSKREADLALRIADPAIRDGGGDYIVSRAGTLDFAAYCRAGSAAAKLARKAPDTWQQLDYVSWDEAWADLPMAKWLKATFSEKSPALACNSIQAQHVAIRAGIGIGVLPCFVGDRDASLERFGSSQPIFSRELWLVYHRDLKASQRMIALRDFIQGLVKNHLS
ncbi:LysR family transcriptional regulator [Noviherbaspirillum sedimenti]|uniref:LysR family transcriptional regulator n=1 Tax=Noviherbaspirillum sedimenti TaxID=2320865 RepID=A0A3A3G442_9BURK|nr:LysR family transcriptional regulator [Noviherbaspirillum sedimenti]RJG02435.1 LysR family transcriptional regulator [Noviherbaspirillum sedimenti]